MNRITVALAGILIAMSLVTGQPSGSGAEGVERRRTTGELVDRLNICLAPRGDAASALPCLWYSPLQEQVDGNSRIIRRSGRVELISDERGRELLLVLIYDRWSL